MIAALLLAVTLIASLQDHKHHAGLNERGKQFMGFDQGAMAHHFILSPNGGRIEVTARATADAKSVADVRTHLRHIAKVFASGDFSIPALVHDRHNQPVPGVERMKGAGAALTYTFEEMDRGGRVNITGTTPDAVAAVHEFLRFQIKDHGTGDPLYVK